MFAVPVLVAHCVVVHLLWRMCVRAGVRPWIATAVTTTFAFLGAGSANLLWGFQITFVGSVAFGLAALLAVESPAAPRRNLYLGWLASVAALACSGIGLIFLLLTAIVVLLRRGWRWAIGFASVPVLAQLTWQVAADAGADGTRRISVYSLSWVPEFVLNGAQFALGSWTGLDGVGGVLLLLVTAVALVQVAHGGTQLTTGVLALGLVPFYLLLAYGRVRLGTDAAVAGRYAYVAVALVLPAVAVAIERVLRRPVHWTALAAVVTVTTSAGAATIVNNARAEERLERTDRLTIQSAQRLLDLDQPILLPDLESHGGAELTAARLRELNERGLRIGTSDLTPTEFLEGRMRLQVEVVPAGPASPGMVLDNLTAVGGGTFTLTAAPEVGAGCVLIASAAGVTFTGASTAMSSFAVQLRAPGRVAVALLDRDGESPTIRYRLAAGEWRRVTGAAPGLQLRTSLPGGSAVVCSENAAWSSVGVPGRPSN